MTDTLRVPLRRWMPDLDWSNYVVYLGFVGTFLYFATTETEYFLTRSNLTNIAVQSAPITVMAVGMVFVLCAGEIDLSIGSVVALAALSAAKVLQEHGNWFLGAAVGLSVGAVVGLVNGLFVTRLRLPSFLVTLATMGLVAGVARQLTDLQSVSVTNSIFIDVFGGSRPLGVQVLIWWTAAIVGAGWVLLRRKRAGAHVLAVGNNAAAARVSGIKVDRVRLMVLVGSATTAAFSGVLYAGRLQGARYTLGEADLMSVIAAVIIGGTSLFGGKGTVVGALIGSLLMGMINNGLVLSGLNVSEQMIVRGVILLAAISLSLRGKRGS